ncbi:MAG: DUF4342 domain-containing protein [Cyanobacteria bacterium J06626_23]
MTNAHNSSPDTPNSPTDNPPTETQVEEFSISGDTLMDKVQELIRESNVRRVLVKNPDGRVLLEVPLTAGLVGGAVGIAFFAPFVAIAAVAGMVARFTLVVERRA